MGKFHWISIHCFKEVACKKNCFKEAPFTRSWFSLIVFIRKKLLMPIGVNKYTESWFNLINMRSLIVKKHNGVNNRCLI